MPIRAHVADELQEARRVSWEEMQIVKSVHTIQIVNYNPPSSPTKFLMMAKWWQSACASIHKSCLKTCPVLQRRNIRNYDTTTKSVGWKYIRYMYSINHIMYNGLDVQRSSLYHMGESRAI